PASRITSTPIQIGKVTFLVGRKPGQRTMLRVIMPASSSKATDNHQRKRSVQVKPEGPVHTLCRRRKSAAEGLGRSPGSEGVNRAIHKSLHLPRPVDRVAF